MKQLLLRFLSFLVPPLVVSVPMKCVSFSGLETQSFQLDCFWHNPASLYLDELGRRGFNWLRIPFSAAYVERGDFSQLDLVFDYAHKWNMSILLDWHRNRNAYWQGDWLDDLSRDDYLKTYKSLISRYVGREELKMIGLFNEHKLENISFWKEQMDYVVRDLENSFPFRFSWLIGCVLWSGNCHDLDWSYLPFADRVFQDIHKYEWSHVINQGYEADWEYSFPNNRKNVIVGEWGYLSDNPQQVRWAEQFVLWLKKNNIDKTCFWMSVSSSGDTGGLWRGCKDWETGKFQLLEQLWNNTKNNNTRSLRTHCHRLGMYQCIRSDDCCYTWEKSCLKCYRDGGSQN